ncbi:MAG TPA: hypothetical protein VKQ52_01365, partial [Puia sp.]|nr:hypothetical protein [Puia sp.]
MISLHLAIKNHLLFGRDYLFTYGPLGVLRCRYPIVVSKYVYLASDLYFLFILFTAFRLLIRRHFQAGAIVFLSVCVLICQYMNIDKWYFFLLLFFLAAYLSEGGKLVYLLHAAVLSVICLYIKVNSGLVNIVFVLAFLHYALFTRKIRWAGYGLFLVGYGITLWLSAWLLHVDLPGYIEGSFQIMKDYQDAMYFPLWGRIGKIVGIGAGIILLLLFGCYGIVAYHYWKVKRITTDTLDILFIYGMVALALFIWFKNAFVRGDSEHLFHFFQMAGPLVLLLYLYAPDGPFRKRIQAGYWLILAVTVVVVNLLPTDLYPNSFRRLVDLSLAPEKVREVRTYFKGLAGYD